MTPISYEVFRAEWLTQHPGSIPFKRADRAKYPRWLKVAIGMMFVCAALVSGVHTIPTVHDGIEINGFITSGVRDAVSLMAFGAVELSILLGAYFRAVNRRLSYGVLCVAFVIAVAANVRSVIHAFALTDAGTVFVALCLGVGAPLMVLLAGVCFLIVESDQRNAAEGSDADYRQALVDLDAKINAAWSKEQKDDSPAVSRDVHELSRETTVSPAPRVNLGEVARRIHENGDEGLSAQALMAKYSISLGGTTKAREMAKSMNGNGNHEHL